MLGKKWMSVFSPFAVFFFCVCVCSLASQLQTNKRTSILKTCIVRYVGLNQLGHKIKLKKYPVNLHLIRRRSVALVGLQNTWLCFDSLFFFFFFLRGREITVWRSSRLAIYAVTSYWPWTLVFTLNLFFSRGRYTVHVAAATIGIVSLSSSSFLFSIKKKAIKLRQDLSDS